MIFKLLLAFLLGVLLALFVVTRLAAGILKVYIPDLEDEQPYLYVELTRPVGWICNKRLVLFRVDTRNLKSHK